MCDSEPSWNDLRRRHWRTKEDLLGGKLNHVIAQLETPDLVAERLAGYLPITGAEHCPQCWMKHGAHIALALEQQCEGVDLLACPRCDFSEFVMSTQLIAVFVQPDCMQA